MQVLDNSTRLQERFQGFGGRLLNESGFSKSAGQPLIFMGDLGDISLRFDCSGRVGEPEVVPFR